MRALFVIGVVALSLGAWAGCGDDDSSPGTESGVMDCQDGSDNDGDGLIDCDDTDCLIHSWCAANQETVAIQCRDGIDNDGDGLIDCDDPSCGVNDFCENCPGCRVGPTCFNDLEVNPGNSCQVCDVSQATDAWTDDDGKGCDDGTFCNGPDTCLAGACSQHAGDPCVAPETCDEATGCLCPGCIINSVCYPDGTVNPQNECQVCDQATSDSQWTDDDGAPCDDNIFCNGVDTCLAGACDAHTGDPCTFPEDCDEGAGQCTCAGCTINGTCYLDGTTNPSNICEVCDVAWSTTAWTDNDGRPCDDGIFCNGPDTCLNFTCSVHPGDPCAPFSCDETNDVCVAQDINITDGANDLPDGSGSYNFGQAVVGGGALVHGFVIENTGNLDLSVTSVAITSGDVGDFTLGAVATPATVVPAGSLPFDITFDPQSLGAKTAEVTVLSDDPDEGTYTFTILGTGASQPANTWTNQNTVTMPTSEFSHRMAHVGGGTVILFGGKDDNWTYYGETWEYDSGTATWTQLTPATAPSARDAHDMVPIGSNQILLFGGKDDFGTPLNDTWIYDATAGIWTQLTTTGSPSARFRHGMAYVGSDTVVLFGGRDDMGTYTNDTWEYDIAANTWTQAIPTTPPAARFGCGMASGGAGVAVMNGGVDTMQMVFTDTWEYNATTDTWTQITASPNPGARLNHELVNLENGFLLLFSGKGSAAWGTPIAGTWVYNVASSTWTNMAPTLEPTPTFAYGMAAIGGGSAVVYGGALVDAGGSYLLETWRYDY